MQSNYENNCGWVLERIEPYLDDELSSGELERFRRHLDHCDTCSRELAFAERVVGELRSLPALEAAPSIVDSAARRIPPEPSPAERLRAWFAQGWATAKRPAMATMIVVIAAVGAFVITEREREARHPAGQQVSEAQVEEATRETLMAFAYVGTYTRRTGRIVRDELVEPVERAMKDTRIIETKPEAERSDT
jgi:anti-sigma factor (TIGR02949 family)